MIDPKAPNTTRTLTLADLKAGGDANRRRIMTAVVEFPPLPDGSTIPPGIIHYIPSMASHLLDVIRAQGEFTAEDSPDATPAEKAASMQNRITLPASYVSDVLCDESGTLMFPGGVDELLSSLDIDTILAIWSGIAGANKSQGEVSGGVTDSVSTSEELTESPISSVSGTSIDGSETTSPKPN